MPPPREWIRLVEELVKSGRNAEETARLRELERVWRISTQEGDAAMRAAEREAAKSAAKTAAMMRAADAYHRGGRALGEMTEIVTKGGGEARQAGEVVRARPVHVQPGPIERIARQGGLTQPAYSIGREAGGTWAIYDAQGNITRARGLASRDMALTILLADDTFRLTYGLAPLGGTAAPARNPLYQAALDADAEYSAELVRVYGDAAGDARYDWRGVSTPTLKRLSEAKGTADIAWLNVMNAPAWSATAQGGERALTSTGDLIEVAPVAGGRWRWTIDTAPGQPRIGPPLEGTSATLGEAKGAAEAASTGRRFTEPGPRSPLMGPPAPPPSAPAFVATSFNWSKDPSAVAVSGDYLYSVGQSQAGGWNWRIIKRGESRVTSEGWAATREQAMSAAERAAPTAPAVVAPRAAAPAVPSMGTTHLGWRVSEAGVIERGGSEVVALPEYPGFTGVVMKMPSGRYRYEVHDSLNREILGGETYSAGAARGTLEELYYNGKIGAAIETPRAAAPNPVEALRQEARAKAMVPAQVQSIAVPPPEVGQLAQVRYGSELMAEGRVEYVTRDGWVGVREANLQLHEWPMGSVLPVRGPSGAAIEASGARQVTPAPKRPRSGPPGGMPPMGGGIMAPVAYPPTK